MTTLLVSLSSSILVIYFQNVFDVLVFRLDFKTILEALRDKVDLNNDGPIANQINVVRSKVLETTLRAMTRRSFNPSRRMNVVFVDSCGTGEGAVDDGGPTREFVRLLMKFNSKCFAGSMED